MKNNSVACGFSFNMEFPHRFHKNGSAKGHLDEWDLIPSGSTGNIGGFLKKYLGEENVHLVISVEKEMSKKGRIAEIILEEEGFSFTPIRILQNTPFAIYPLNGGSSHTLYGDGGRIVTEPELILSEAEKIRSVKQTWRIASGVRSSLFPLMELFFSEEYDGHRSLCPNPELFKNTIAFERILRMTDLMILNEFEFSRKRISIKEVHRLGMEILIVTKAERGGVVFLCNKSTNYRAIRFEFDAVFVHGIDVFSVGAGDWLHASLMGYFIKLGISLKEVDKSTLLEGLSFAVNVVSKKILLPGGPNGPSREEILEIEENIFGPSAQRLVRYGAV